MNTIGPFTSSVFVRKGSVPLSTGKRRDPAIAISGHRRIVDAIKRRDAEAAELAVREHIAGARRHGLSLLDA